MGKGRLLREYGTDLRWLSTRCTHCAWRDTDHPRIAWARLCRHTIDAHPDQPKPPRPDEYAVLRWRHDTAVRSLASASLLTMLKASSYVEASEALHRFVDENSLRGTDLDPATQQRKAWDRWLRRRLGIRLPEV